MSTLNISIYDSYIILDNISLIKEFSDTTFRIDIKDSPYILKGENLILSEVSNNNQTIKITGVFRSIELENNKPKNKTNFFKKLFS